jgi:hypothetical protein
VAGLDIPQQTRARALKKSRPTQLVSHYVAVMPGEEAQLTGFDGLRRAKEWLEASTRVKHSWTVYDTGLRELLEFAWPYGGQSFSFDLGGKLRGDELEGKTFLAEIKNYKSESDLPVHWRKFLASCYVARGDKPERSDNFMWISWAPFQAQKWHEHATPADIRKALVHKDNRKRLFDTEDEDEAKAAIDEALVADIAKRIWMITLSEKQESLVIARDYYAEVIKMMTLAS